MWITRSAPSFWMRISPETPGAALLDAVRQRSDELELTGTHVFFHDSPVTLCRACRIPARSGREHEPRTCRSSRRASRFRTHVLDALWAGIVPIVSDSDTMADLLRAYDAGRIVPPGDDAALARDAGEPDRQPVRTATPRGTRAYAWAIVDMGGGRPAAAWPSVASRRRARACPASLPPICRSASLNWNVRFSKRAPTRSGWSASLPNGVAQTSPRLPEDRGMGSRFRRDDERHLARSPRLLATSCPPDPTTDGASAELTGKPARFILRPREMHVARSSSGLGHHPLKVEITGSNPVRATNDPLIPSNVPNRKPPSGGFHVFSPVRTPWEGTPRWPPPWPALLARDATLH